MTDRLKGFVVVLEHNMRDDDAQRTIDAINQIRGVRSVESVLANPNDQIIEARVRQDIGMKLFEIVYPTKD